MQARGGDVSRCPQGSGPGQGPVEPSVLRSLPVGCGRQTPGVSSQNLAPGAAGESLLSGKPCWKSSYSAGWPDELRATSCNEQVLRRFKSTGLASLSCSPEAPRLPPLQTRCSQEVRVGPGTTEAPNSTGSRISVPPLPIIDLRGSPHRGMPFYFSLG